MKKTAAKQTFESSLAELERIVRDMEQGDLPLEESLQLFEQGVRLSHECQERLTEAERRIEVLLRDSQGRPLVKSLGDSDTGATSFATSNDDEDDDELDEDEASTPF